MSAEGMLKTITVTQLHNLGVNMSDAVVETIRKAIDEAYALGLREGRADAIDSINTDELYDLIRPYGGKDCAYNVSDWLEKKAADARQGGM
jgi:hypothetical protein